MTALHDKPPTLGRAALHGWFGEVVNTISPETEACEAALLVQALAMYGCAVGVRPYFQIGGARHSARINFLLSGYASSGRKGQSAAEVGAVFAHVDADWYSSRVMSGLASGEGLIASVRDGRDDEDQGVTDKRLQIIEPEFSRVLRVAARDGSTLSEVLRECFDTGRLRVMTRKDPLVATGAHVSVIGHITPSEFLERMKDLDVSNGFLTRYPIVEVGRTQLLPHGGNLTTEDFSRLGRLGRKHLAKARETGVLRHSPAGAALWDQLYRLIHKKDRPEVGTRWAIMARADTNLLRISMIYALGDGSDVIDVEHIEAAWAVMTYVDDSVERLFGTLTGNRIADRLFAHLPDDPLHGLDGTQQRDLFDRHATGEQLADARDLLEELGLAHTRPVETGGRPKLVTCRQSDESAISDQSPARDELWSLRSLRSQSQEGNGSLVVGSTTNPSGTALTRSSPARSAPVTGGSGAGQQMAVAVEDVPPMEPPLPNGETATVVLRSPGSPELGICSECGDNPATPQLGVNRPWCDPCYKAALKKTMSDVAKPRAASPPDEEEFPDDLGAYCSDPVEA